MNHLSRSASILIGLVLTVYLMRNANISVGNTLSRSFRTLTTITISHMCNDVNINEPYSAAQTDQAEGAISSVKTLRGGNPLKTALLTQSEDDIPKEYGMSLIGVVVPWVAMFLISLICCCSLCCNWCYLHGCCKGKRICSCCKPPKHQTKMKLCVGLTLFFLTGVLAAGVAGAVISSEVSKGLKRTYCSIIGMGVEFNNGVAADDWIGLKPALTSIDKVLQDLNSTITSLSSISTTVNSVRTAAGAVDTELDSLTSTYSAQTQNRPDPAESPTTYKSSYISNIGPKETSGTYTSAIHLEVKAKSDIAVEAGTSINTAIQNVQSQMDNINRGLSNGRTTTSRISTQVEDLFGGLEKNESDVDSALTGVGIGFLVLFLVNLVLAALAIISVILLIRFRGKSAFFRKFLHFSWCCYLLLTLLGFILSAVLYTGSLVMTEVCDTSYSLLTDQEVLRQVSNKFLSGSREVTDMLNTCFYTNGNLLTNFDLAAYLGDFDTMFTQLDRVNQNISLDTTSIPSVTIPLQQALVDLWQNGRVADAPEIVTDLATLNTVVNSASTSCANVKDTWFLNSMNCTSGQGYKFQGTDTAAQGYPNPTCLGFEAWNTGTHNINDRYPNDGSFSTCSQRAGVDYYQYARDFVTRFANARTAVVTLFTSIRGSASPSLATISTRYSTFETSMVNLLAALKDVRTKLANIQDSLTGETNGLLENTKCKFIKTGTLRMLNATCVGLVSNLYYTSVLIIIMSCMSLFSILWIFILLKRVNVPVYEIAKTTSPSV